LRSIIEECGLPFRALKISRITLIEKIERVAQPQSLRLHTSRHRVFRQCSFSAAGRAGRRAFTLWNSVSHPRAARSRPEALPEPQKRKAPTHLAIRMTSAYPI
jgi:hypothetical protein